MPREIKFRGWNKSTKRMIDPHKLTPLALNSECKDLKGLFLPFHEDVELMQFTGLLDKNSKEIWEGDIVLTDEADWIGEVIFNHGMFMCRDKKGGFASFCNWDKFEVIGNIYENPELL